MPSARTPVQALQSFLAARIEFLACNLALGVGADTEQFQSLSSKAASSICEQLNVATGLSEDDSLPMLKLVKDSPMLDVDKYKVSQGAYMRDRAASINCNLECPL